MATMVSDSIDVDKPAKYPIILSDALLGRGSKELFTSIRYNHKPTQSSDSSLGSHELKPSASGDSTTYELTFKDGSDKYEYQGIRKSGDGEFVLVFDSEKKHFVLHQVDSAFDMNLTSSPWDDDKSNLQKSYEQLSIPSKPRRKNPSQPKPKPKPVQSSRTSADTKRRKVEKSKPKKSKTPPREPTPDAEDEDSDDGLTIEYPGGAPPQRFQSHLNSLREHREVKHVREESDADGENEEDDDNDRNGDVEAFDLPSPAANVGNISLNINEVEELEEEEEVDLDLAAELEQALEKETGAKADESSESEEE